MICVVLLLFVVCGEHNVVIMVTISCYLFWLNYYKLVFLASVVNVGLGQVGFKCVGFGSGRVQNSRVLVGSG